MKEIVPIYDGREKFQLGNYWERPYAGEPAKGSTVMLLFSIRKGTLPQSVQGRNDLPRDLKVAIYFNILGAIVLAEPAERVSNNTSQEPPQSFGVENIRTDLSGDDEGEGRRVDEAFL